RSGTTASSRLPSGTLVGATARRNLRCSVTFPPDCLSWKVVKSGANIPVPLRRFLIDHFPVMLPEHSHGVVGPGGGPFRATAASQSPLSFVCLGVARTPAAKVSI